MIKAPLCTESRSFERASGLNGDTGGRFVCNLTRHLLAYRYSLSMLHLMCIASVYKSPQLTVYTIVLSSLQQLTRALYTLHVNQLVRRVGKLLAMSVTCTIINCAVWPHCCHSVCTKVDSLASGRPEKGRGWVSLLLLSLQFH